jgi:hypothetical protein
VPSGDALCGHESTEAPSDRRILRVIEG